MFAANRAGKTDSGAYVGATLARFGDQSPDVKWVGGKGSSIQIRDRATSGWVSCLDFPTARDVVQPKYFDNGYVPPGATHEPFIPKREIESWRQDLQLLKLKNGSIIGFKSVDSGREKYQGTEKDWVHMDEEHPKDIYDEIMIRVGARRMKIVGTATLLPPEGEIGGVSWMFDAMIKPWLIGLKHEFNIFQASIYDNPYIPEEELRRLESKYPEGSIDRRIRMNGELIAGLAGSRAYTGFQAQVNVREQGPINFRRPLCWTWDFNVEPMCSLIGQIERLPSGKRVFKIFKELVIRTNASITEMVDMFYQFHPRHGAEVWIYGDATSRHRRGNVGKSDYTIILNEMVRYGCPIKLKVPESNPGVPDRINAVNRVCRDHDAEVRLEVDPSCSELLADLDSVLRDARGGIKKTYNAKDPYFWRTHTSDALGYWIHYEEPVQRITEETAKSSPKIGQVSYRV
jgi:phage terminase large subunit-like protein